MSSLITSVTHNIPWVLRTPAEAIIGEVRFHLLSFFSPRFLPASIVCVRSSRERGEADQSLVPVCLWYEPTQECYKTLIYDFDILDGPCLKYALSKGLGLGIVLGGSIVKIPQVRSSP